MARGRKRKEKNNSSEDNGGGNFNSDEFESIDLPIEIPIEEEEFEQPNLDAASFNLQSSDEKLHSVKSQLEEQLIFGVTEQALSAFSGTESYGFENIVGVGISEKLTGNKYTGKKCVTVYVVSKETEDEIDPQALVPKNINGVPTDVVAVGELKAFPHKGRYRPAPGGVSVGHYKITAGTIACLVRRGNQLYILSNNHVLANSNSANIGDPIMQPGPFDGGVSAGNIIGRLSEFVPINMSGGVNFVDAAIAQTSPNLVTPESKCFGSINPNPQNCGMWMIVKKCGRTTQTTRGIVTDCNATVRVGYGNSTAIFQNQMIIVGVPGIAPFSQPGDSGSLVLNQFSNRPVGLLFAGSSLITIASPIQTVLSLLNVSIVS